MPVIHRKYSCTAFVVLLFFLQGTLWTGCGRMNHPWKTSPAAEAAAPPEEPVIPRELLDSLNDEGEMVIVADSVVRTAPPAAPVPDSLMLPLDTLNLDSLTRDNLLPDSLVRDSLALDSLAPDSLAADSIRTDSLGRRDYGKQFLDDVISGHNQDSLVYDVKNSLIYLYNQAEVEYQDKVLKNADYVVMRMDTKHIDAYGIPDSLGIPSRPIFVDAGKEYTMDSINYNLDSGKAKIKGVWTTEGDGIMRGQVVKKMPDNTINIAHGKYSTCDADHPHFYIEMSKAKVIPGQKAIFGYSYLVMEDVPIPFLMLPFGFFPLNEERSSGFIMPSFGEEYRGFFLRDGGYYYAPNDYIDMALTGSIFTLGSWDAQLRSNYRVRYKFNGNLNFHYNNTKFGDRGSDDYGDQRTFKFAWTHSQDAKFKPGSTFSASVNVSSSQNGRYGSGTMNDYTTNQTTSSISYQKNWAGSPFNLAVSLRHSQVNKDSTMSLTFPQLSFNMSRINPFKFKNRRPGAERWYEKIAVTYNTNLTNEVSSIKEYDMFTDVMFDEMKTRMTHSLPITASFALFNYINLSPSINYSETWDTKKYMQHWDDDQNRIVTDTVRGFQRIYQYSGSMSASTTVYGMYDNFGPRSKIQAIRHTVAPSVSVSYTPGMAGERHGFYLPVQTDAEGNTTLYSPYQHMGSPPRKTSATMSFTLKQSLEAKVRSDQDSTGVKKISIIDDLTIGAIGYNFMADSMKLSQSVPVNLRSTLIKGFNINLSTSFGLYELDRNGNAYDKLLWSNGKPPRLERLATSFNWSKSFGKGSPNAMNTGTNMAEALQNHYDPTTDPLNALYDPTIQQMEEQQGHADIYAYRNLLSSQYYDFSVPLNVNFGYSISYTNTRGQKTILQTTNFGFSMNLTPKWGITVRSGYDVQARKITNDTSFTLTRDLHCWQMNFNWVPLGPRKSWNFHISVKANVLRDLKYEKSGDRWGEQLYRR